MIRTWKLVHFPALRDQTLHDALGDAYQLEFTSAVGDSHFDSFSYICDRMRPVTIDTAPNACGLRPGSIVHLLHRARHAHCRMGPVGVVEQVESIALDDAASVD